MYLADIFLCFEPGSHDLMAAAQAFEAEVCAGTQNLPPLFPAGMGLFHHQNVV
jgi:hypothetical protein